MGREIDLEIRYRGEEMYIVDGLTFEQVAAETGVSVTQLKNWSAADGWREKREEYRRTRKDLQSTLLTLRKNMAERAKNDPDPQNIYAFIRLETLADRKEKKHEVVAKIDKPTIFLENIEFIASVLKDIDPEGLKALAKNFDELITRFKAKNAQTA